MQKNRMTTNPILLILFGILTYGQAQKPVSTKSVSNVGTSVSELSKSILVVFQASNGDYWFGSDADGVYRYNGKTTIRYSEADGLSNNRIRSIQEDKLGNIYIATLGGINKFDGKTLTSLTAIKSNSSKDNWKLQPDDLWFCMPGKNGDKGPYRYDGTNLYQLKFPGHHLEAEYFEKHPNNAWSPYEVYYIYKDSKGTMWFGTSNFGLCRYDGLSHSWLYEEHLTNVPNGGSFGIRSIIEDAKGKYWFCNTRYRYQILPESVKKDDKFLVKYNRQKGIEGIKRADADDYVYFMSAVNDKNGGLWMATYNQGVWHYDGKKATQYSVKDGAKTATLYSVYKDKKGMLWLGSHEAGVYRFDGKTFVQFKP